MWSKLLGYENVKIIIFCSGLLIKNRSLFIKNQTYDI